MTEKKQYVKRGGVVFNATAKTWSAYVDLGPALFRRCPRCRRRFWLRDAPDISTCARDGAALAEPMSARRQQWLHKFPTQKAARAARRVALGQIDTNTYAPRTNETFSAFLDAWLASRTNIRPTTAENYEVCIRAYIRPRIGAVRLVDITPDVLDRFYAELSRSGGRNGRALAPKTVRNVHLVVHRALLSAVKARKLTVNPADACDAVPASEPRQVREKRMRETIWSPREMRTFLDVTRGDRLGAAWQVLAMTGVRRGELLGLAWNAVDLDEGTIRVEQGLVLLSRQPTITPVKSNSSAATIMIDSATVAALKEHKRHQVEERLAAGPAYDNEHDLVFTDVLGAPIHPDVLARAFKAGARRAGLREIRLHDVRHSYASALLASGASMKVISERLRHAGIGITSDLYVHLSPEMDRASAESGAAFILGS